MYHGSIVSLLQTVIQGLVSFSFNKNKPMAASQEESFMVMHMQDVFGKAKTAEEIGKSIKQTLVMPNDYSKMQKMIKRQHAIVKEWLGPNSHFTVKQADFIDNLKAIKQSIKIKESNDMSFCTKILYAAGLLEQEFMKACRDNDDRENVLDLNYDSLIQQIKYGQFNIDLPPSFKRIDNKRPRDDSNNSTSELQALQSEIKRLKSEINNTGNSRNQNFDERKTDNSEMVEAFKLKDNEKYKKVFCGPNKHKTLPSIGDCQMCPKWLIQGKCFTDCRRINTHLPASKIPQDKQKEFSEWMAKCRALGGRS